MAKDTSFITISGASESNRVTRADMTNGMVFVKKSMLDKGKQPNLYAHVGVSEIPPSSEVRYRSINLTSGEEASTANGDIEVVVVGTYELSVTLHEDFEHLAG